jgi:O-6-methylguanine DNA methyltransferase
LANKRKSYLKKASLSSFRKKVYQAVLGIPLGQVRSYKWVAKRIGKACAYRAVGTALSKNPYPLIIPCHRVVKSNKEIGGYIFGEKKKRILLNLEKKLSISLKSIKN